MQRPRRTSEFQDDPNCVRRQSRIQQRSTLAPSPSGGGSTAVASCTSGTAKKFARQSRIAVPSRPSSTDRSANTYLAVPSSAQRGVTPQKTPLPKNSANRVLFTAEKQRTSHAIASNSVPLHNDKKWVQEQTHRITEHLLTQTTLGAGISTDFVSRGLRQMSIKQFVAVVNYFLRYIWGSRFTVGTNYVDDIINILQKLQYPYPINKSWLKTPNTQHSFGNVIVLLDFLMDFVPPGKEEDEIEMYFDLKDPEGSTDSIEDIQIPSLRFQQELLRHSEKGFMLWDKQKNEECDSLKRHTCDLLIQEKCGIDSLEAIKIEIEKLKDILKSLQNDKPPEDREMIKLKTRLSREIININSETKKLQDEYESNDRDLKDLVLRKMDTIKEVETIEKEIALLQEKLNTQSCTVDQRDQMIADVMQHKQMIAIKERAIQDLETRYHNEQIQQSKALKHLNEQIENFNAHVREIKFSDIKNISNILNEDILELSLRPDQSDLDRLIPQLERINEIVVNSINENKQKIIQARERCKQLTNDIDANLYPLLNDLRTANAKNAANLEKLVNSFKNDEHELLVNIEKVDEDLLNTEKSINELQSVIENKMSLINELAQANEQKMQNAEQRHHQCLEQKKAFLKAYEEVLEECMHNGALQQLTMQVELQEKQLEKIRKEFKK